MQLRLTAATRRAFGAAKVYCYRTFDEAEASMEHLGAVDLMLLDLEPARHTALDAVKSFKDIFPTARLVVLSASDERKFITSCLRAGADGYLPRSSASRVMVAALRLVAAGATYVPRQAVEAERPSQLYEAHNPIARRLTQRQRDVLRAILDGCNNAEIAAELEITPGTVKQHIHAIFKALGVSTRSRLFALAARGAIRQDGSPITKVI